MRKQRTWWRAAGLTTLLLGDGCGGSDALRTRAGDEAYSLDEHDLTEDSMAMAGQAAPRDTEFRRTAEPALLAQVAAEAAPSPEPPSGGHAAPDAASDATRQPLVIYRASLHLAVYEVEATQAAILAHIETLGGRLSRRTDQQLIVRVPASHFEEALGHTEEQGDVIHRDVTAQDVGEEYRDLEIRIRNLEVMRTRLEQLLTQADDIEAALAIERELQRLTTDIERMKGRVRYLADQVAFSTITITFQPKRDEDTTPDTFRLPFSWLNELGLQRLMRL